MAPWAVDEVGLDAEVIAAADPDLPIGVAVSGGGDSIALLYLLKASGRAITVVTVDHGLRDGSAAEAAGVAALCEALDVPHKTLRWEGNPSGNLQDAARKARRQLIGGWALGEGLDAVALGHTADDQAETFLMRLSRGSGVEGLSAMEPVVDEGGLRWLRPMLHLRRDALRAYLAEIGATWVEDPSNEDSRFDRVKMRAALGTLDKAGISVNRIAKTTKRLRSAKQVLFTATRDLAAVAVQLSPEGELRFDIPRLLSAQPAVRLRLLAEALRFIGGAYYAPRAEATEAVLAELEGAFRDRTLGGCQLRQSGATLFVRRELAAVGAAVPVGTLWDERWIVTGPATEDLTVSALGKAGLFNEFLTLPEGISRETLAATPAIWSGERLISAPLAGFTRGYAVKFTAMNPFFTSQHLSR